MSRLVSTVKGAVQGVGQDQVLTHAAALAFYTALSLPPLLVLLAWALGSLGGDAEAFLASEAEALAGADARELVRSVLDSADREVRVDGPSGWLGLGALLFAASGVFSQLQNALNRVWLVQADPASGVRGWLRKRFLSLGIVGVVAFLLAVSLASSVFVERVGVGTGGGAIARAVDLGANWAVFSLLFVVVFRVLPDARVPWKEAAGGACLTGALFIGGKSLVSLYLARKGLSASYGAAGSAVVVLAWVYFSGVILLMGAELTQAWIRAGDRRIEPEAHAYKVQPRQRVGEVEA